MPREQRGGKVTEPISIRKWGSRSTAKPSGDVVPTYEKVTTTTPVDGSQGEDFGEILTETQGQLTGFEDTRGGIRKFLDTLSGRPSTANQLNAQLALGRDQSDRAFTQAKELEGIRSTADLTKMQKEFELRKQEKQFDQINRLSFEQEQAKLAIKKAILDSDLKAQAAAEDHLRKLAEQQDQAINAVAVARGLTPAQVLQGASTWMQQATEDSVAKQEASKAAAAGSRVTQGVSQSQLDAIGGVKGSKIPRKTALSSVTEPMLASGVKNKKDSLIVLNERETGFVGGYGEHPTTVYTPGRPGTPGALGKPGTPPVDPNVRTLKDPDAIRAEMESLKRAAASSRYPVSSNPVAAGQFWDEGNQGVVAGRAAPQTTTAAPQTTTAAAPQATGLIPSFKRLGSLIPSLQEVSLAGEYAVRAGEDFLETPAIGSPEASERARKRALRDQELYRHFNEPRIQPQPSPIPVTQPAGPVAPQRTTSNNQSILDILNQILR